VEQMPGKCAIFTTACPLAHTFHSPACGSSTDAMRAMTLGSNRCHGSSLAAWKEGSGGQPADVTATPAILASRSVVGLRSRLPFHWVVRGVDSRRNVHGVRGGGKGCLTGFKSV